MAAGSALFRVKEALFTQLDLSILNMLYDSPSSPDEVIGADGLGAVCWFSDEAQSELETNLLMGQPLWMDETITLTLVIQVLGRDSSYDQRTVDNTATEMLGVARAILLSNPDLFIPDDDDIQIFHVLPRSYQYRAGFLNHKGRAARFEQDVEVKARLKLATVNGNP